MSLRRVTTPSRSPRPRGALPLSVWLLAVASPAAAQEVGRRIDAQIERIVPGIVELRHTIHRNPELGNREVETAALIAKHLEGLGLEVRTGVAHTGVVALLRGGRPGPVVAVRADMDALPVTERTDLPFKSTKQATYLGQEVGVAHACGHDIHTVVALGVASALASMRKDLPGTVKFIFQPAEEGPPPGERGGAVLMIEEGVLQNPRPAAIFALHSFPDFTVGQVGYRIGPMLAAVDHFTITIRGRQSHGAYPHLGIDPIVIASQAVLALQTIRSRNLSPLEPSVVTVGILRGGERFNIIPEEVHLEGTVRTYSEETRDEVERRMREILEGVTRAGGGSYELAYERRSSAVINDRALAERVLLSLRRALGDANVIEVEPKMGGEDFAEYARVIPGFYFWLGVVAPGTTSGGLHTPDFRADDGAILVGVRAVAHVVADYLRAAGR